MSDNLLIDVLSQKDRIMIMLEEYKTLRTEMIERHTAFLQMFSMAAAALTAAAGWAVSQKLWTPLLIVGAAVAVGVTVGFLILNHDSYVLSEQLRKIEADINKRTSDQLLSWETTRGIEQYGYLERIRDSLRRLRAKPATTPNNVDH
jgi:hypothetical protein